MKVWSHPTSVICSSSLSLWDTQVSGGCCGIPVALWAMLVQNMNISKTSVVYLTISPLVLSPAWWLKERYRGYKRSELLFSLGERRVRSSDDKSGVELLFFCKKRPIEVVRAIYQDASYHPPLEVFRTCGTGRRTSVWWGDYIFHPAWERLIKFSRWNKVGSVWALVGLEYSNSNSTSHTDLNLSFCT